MPIDKKTRTVVRSVKLTEAEDKAVHRAAQKAGLAWSVYAREVLLRQAAPELTTGERMRHATERD